MVKVKVMSLLVLIALVFSGGSASANVSAADNLTVNEGFVNPIGFYASDPDFSWILPQGSSVDSQSAYQVVVASSPKLLPQNADLWDSGKVSSSQSTHVKYQGKPLVSRQKVYWQVRYWDQKGRKSNWSKPASFELGLLNNSDWKGSWIKMKGQDETQVAENTKIEILSAAYCADDDSGRKIELTEKVKSLVKDGNYKIPSSNEFAGGDPADRVVKILKMEYMLNEEKVVAEVKEGSIFNLVTKIGGILPAFKYVPEYLRKDFNVDSKVESARLYITAKGLYEVYLNGKRIGSDYMVPGWTPYHKRIETITYDVTKDLQKKDNVLAAILGEGWFAGDLMGKLTKYPELQPQLLAQLEITYKDGSKETIVTDKSWKATDEGPIRYSSIYHGETYDASKEMSGWNDTDFDDSFWYPVAAAPVEADVRLVPKRQNTVQVETEIKALSITEPTEGKYIFDLGQNMVGWQEIKIPVKAGDTITVRFAEMLDTDGTMYTVNYRGAKSTDYYTAAKDGVICWHPTFTFHGFRYVELSGFSDNVKPKKSWVKGCVLHSAFGPATGQFESSHSKLNQLQKNITWGQRGNYLEVPTDCPQRDERLGWTGDAQVFCPTSLFNYDVYSFWASWLESMRDDQREDGYVPNVVPSVSCGYGSPGWGDVSVVSPWDVYVRTGDLDILRDNYEMMKGWTDAYGREAEGYIVDRNGYGDWLQPFPCSGNFTDTLMDVIATSYFGRCTTIMANSAKLLGKEQDAKKYSEQFKNIRKAFSSKYFDDKGYMTVPIPTQTSYLMALGYGLLEPELREGAMQGLLKLIEESDGNLRTGFLGTPLINQVLDDYGHSDIAYQVLFKETYPSWFYSINQGATTMWERWNSYSQEDGFGDPGMNSFNHYAYGAINQFMVERIAGLAPDSQKAGYKHFYIQPTPGEQLTWAKAEYQTPYGKASSGWKMTSKGLKIDAVVPTNTTATLIVPEEVGNDPILKESGKKCSLTKKGGKYVYELGPGKYKFILEN